MSVALSVIVPSLNGGAILREHLGELCAQARRLDGGAEVLVVDDASEAPGDETAEVVAAQADVARLVRSGSRRGFAGACNLGAGEARGELLLFLNNDMHPAPGCLDALQRAIAGRDELFALTPVIDNLAQGFGESTTRMAWRRGVFDVRFPGRSGRASPGPGGQRRIAYACGGALLCRRDRFLDLGGFSELYAPFYWEDADLGWRARRAGWELVESGDARVLHDHARTIGARHSARRIRALYERNRLLFTWCHISGAARWLAHLGWTPLRWVAAIARGDAGWRGLPMALGRLGTVLRARRSLRSSVDAARRLAEQVAESGPGGWPADRESS